MSKHTQHKYFNYLFFMEGLSREVWQDGVTENAARQALLDSLTDEEKKNVGEIKCIDEQVI